MRILFITRHYYDDIEGGGQEKFVVALANNLAQMGDEVGIAAFKATHHAPRKEVKNGVTIYRLGGIRELFSTRFLGFTQVIKDFQADAVILSTIQYAYYGAFMKYLTGVKVYGIVNDFHDIYGYRKVASIPFSINRRYFMHLIDGAIGANSYASSLIKEASSVKAYETTTGFDLPEPLPIKTCYRNYSENGEPYTFVFIGRMQKEKGVVVLAKAFENFHRFYPNSRCIFIGGGKYLSTFKEKWNGAGIEVRGFLPETEMLKELSRADVFINPSYIKEGLVITNVQAMRLGVPVISTDVGGVKDAITDGKNGILVQPENEKDLFNAMEKIAFSKDVRRMARMGRFKSSIFSGKASAGQLKEILEHV